MKVIGMNRVDFNAPDGNRVQGYSIYYSFPLNKGKGEGAEKVFLSDAKINASGYLPEVGDDIVINYNKYGKVHSVNPVF